MDELAKYNKERWEALAQAKIAYSRPFLDLNADSARKIVDPFGFMGDVTGKDVLCLASGGGQQSAAFALLGARVTVFDLSETQLERDREAQAHYGVTIRTEQGDMRDLTRFGMGAFDIVWQAYSINFVPDSGQVFEQVARVLRPGGLYHMDCRNPFYAGVEETTWNGEGYLITRTYADGEIEFASDNWEFESGDGTVKQVEGPREFNHKLSTLLNGLVTRGFTLLKIQEAMFTDEPDSAPGTWGHYNRVAPPMLELWCRYAP